MEGVVLAMSGLLESLKRSDLLKYLIYTEKNWVQIWIFLKTQDIDKGIS